MPHFIIEYSANLADSVDIPAVLVTVQKAVLETGIFPVGGLRVRAFPCQDYIIGDGHADNCYLHMTLKMGHGRTAEVKKTAGEAVFAALCDCLAEAFAAGPLAISYAIEELDPVLNFKKNNLHEAIEARAARSN